MITVLGYVPEGYELKSSFITPKNGRIEYSLNNQEMIFEYFSQNHDIYSNNDYSNYISIIQNGQEYFYYIDSDNHMTCSIIWNDDGYSYNLYANLPIDELITIAESIY